MRRKSYRGHRVELESEAQEAGEWVPRVIIAFSENNKEIRIPIFGRRRMTFATEAQADSYGFELAKLWIDGRLWGTNGHG
jgi:hypothetical protein